MVRIAIGVSICLVSAGAYADDAYYRVSALRLTIHEGEWPGSKEPRWLPPAEMNALRPYAVLDAGGEAYVARTGDSDEEGLFDMAEAWFAPQTVLLVRSRATGPIHGWLFLPDEGVTRMTALRFEFDEEAGGEDAEHAFHIARARHYERLLETDTPGSAWYRRQAAESRRASGTETPDRRFRGRRELDDTYNLINGGRAVSENLQLARELPGTDPGTLEPEKVVEIGTISGITVPEMAWPETDVPLDKLAGLIPADQHAVFCPDFVSLTRLLDETNEEGLPAVRSMRARPEDAGLLARYESQMGVSRDLLTRLLGPSLMKSAVITGSDPYFPTGTDVAVLMETTSPAALAGVLLARTRSAAGPGEYRTGEIDGLAYQAVVSADRSVSAYVCALEGAAVVTNSPEQIRRLAAVRNGGASIASLPEYRFFRGRYPVGAAGETAFIFLSDATIRRWCGPEWRIGSSRRLRAAAILADATAARMDEIVTGVQASRGIESEMPMRTIGTLTLGPGGVRSSVYGSLSFLTPIAELGISEATESEAAAYERWRRGYERNWNWAFDPIGISIGVGPERLSADMTIMPLIAGSQYRQWINASMGASLAPGSGDPHDAIAHGVVAVNAESDTVKQWSGFARMMAPGLDFDPLSWVGQSVAVYADPDPFWAELMAARDTEEFMGENMARMPVALYAEASSAIRLTAFVAAARAFVEATAPGMTAWDPRTHAGQGYVRVGLSETARADAQGRPIDELAVFYAAMPRALIVSINEDVLKRAIDRELARRSGTAPESPRAWLGSSMCLQFDAQGLELVYGPGAEAYRNTSRLASWSNVRILNEWRRLYPDQDPVEVHRRVWGTELVCPGGGRYEWNDRFRTLTSTVYGCPGDRGSGPTDMGPLTGIRSGNLGLTFEENGLRARTVIERSPGDR